MKESRVYKCLYGSRNGYSRRAVYVQAQDASEAARKLKQMLDERGYIVFDVLETIDIGELWEQEPTK
jgi:hypothetical protein